MRGASYLALGSGLLAMACNSVLGIEQGHFQGESGAGGSDSQSTPLPKGGDEPTDGSRASGGSGGQPARTSGRGGTGAPPVVQGGQAGLAGAGEASGVPAASGGQGGARTGGAGGMGGEGGERIVHCSGCAGESEHATGGSASCPSLAECEGNVLKYCDDVGGLRVRSCTDEGQACIEEPLGSGRYGCGGDCVPRRQRCLANTVQMCSDRGSWKDTTGCEDQTCTESSEGASCRGECAPGQLRCSDDGAPEKCNDGDWVQAGACSSSESSYEVCRGGVCVPADHVVGVHEAYADNVTAYADALLVCRLPKLEHDAILRSFNVIGGTEGTQGVAARMVLYEDDGSGYAPDGDPVAQTAGAPFQLAADTEVSVGMSEVEPTLSAGKLYWVGLATAQETSVRGVVTPERTGLCRVSDFDFGTAFGPAASGILLENTNVNLFLGVRDID